MVVKALPSPRYCGTAAVRPSFTARENQTKIVNEIKVCYFLIFVVVSFFMSVFTSLSRRKPWDEKREREIETETRRDKQSTIETQVSYRLTHTLPLLWQFRLISVEMWLFWKRKNLEYIWGFCQAAVCVQDWVNCVNQLICGRLRRGNSCFCQFWDCTQALAG